MLCLYSQPENYFSMTLSNNMHVQLNIWHVYFSITQLVSATDVATVESRSERVLRCNNSVMPERIKYIAYNRGFG